MTNNSCDHVRVFAANVTSGHNRNSNSAERHGRGISQQHGNSGLERLHTESKNHGCGNCHGGTEASQSLKQATEAERNEDCLDAQITAAETVKGAAQIFKTP